MAVQDLYLTIEHQDQDERCDIVLSKYFECTRSFIKKNAKIITINGKEAKLSKKLKYNDKVHVKIEYEEYNNQIIPQEYPLSVLYEDQYILAIRKPFLIPVHPAAGHPDNTICNYVMDYLHKKGILLHDAGLVHRLDMDTEGVMIFAKDLQVQEKIRQLFKNRKIRKYYFAIVEGNIEKHFSPLNLNYNTESPLFCRSDIISRVQEDGLLAEGYRPLADFISRDKNNRMKYTIRNREGKKALLYFKELFSHNGYSLLSVRLITGRTHQIRVQFSDRFCPIIGDRIYSASHSKFWDNFGLQLFSYRLCFDHPVTGTRLDIRASLPERIKKFIYKEMK